jgi:hypothetical protein
MTHEGAPAVFVVYEVATVRAAVDAATEHSIMPSLF